MFGRSDPGSTTFSPTGAPIAATDAPTPNPTDAPTAFGRSDPGSTTLSPTASPTTASTASPTTAPTASPNPSSARGDGGTESSNMVATAFGGAIGGVVVFILGLWAWSRYQHRNSQYKYRREDLEYEMGGEFSDACRV